MIRNSRLVEAASNAREMTGGGNGPGLLPMMRWYVALESTKHSPKEALRKLIGLIKSVAPEIRFDSDGRILWAKPRSTFSIRKETRL